MDKNRFLQYFHFNKILLHFCGVLPLETWGFIPNAISIALPFCAASFLVLPFFYTLIFCTLDFETAMDIFCLLLEGIAATFKAILILRKRKQLNALVSLCDGLWKNVNNKEAEVMRHYAVRGMYFTYGFFFNILAALINVLVQPAFEKFVFNINGTMITSKTLPFPSGLFHEDVKLFNIWYLMQVPAGIIVLILIVGIDTAVVVFILHACAHFNLLQYRILLLKQSFQSDHHQVKGRKREIVTIVKYHQEILQYSEALEDVFNNVVLLQTVLSITAICIFGINCILKDEDILNQVLHVVGGTLQLLMFCWPPNNLQTESYDIALKIYDLPWYEWPKEEQRLIEMIIFRSQKFVILSAGKFTSMSLRTFTSILSSAYSFFTLLRRIL